ncbi:MAG: hypothetical protein WBG92_20405, partial [Thiohalocapsa sp.]
MADPILRAIITDAADETGFTLSDLTVLAPQRDPYRLDTPANHARGQWLADAFIQVVGPHERIHLRGLHYRLVGRVNLPNGKPYINDAETWTWLSEHVIKPARFLGYVPWNRLVDARNAPPQVYREQHRPPHWTLDAGEVEVYLPESLSPELRVEGDLYRQPYQQIIVAEKSGIGDLIAPIARRYHATLALPNGEWSDGQLYDTLADAVENDGRPVVIHQLGDFDPAGWQMAVSTARTAQAIRDSLFSDLEIKVHAPALTLEQCIDWDLPSTPLKQTERRADRWFAAMGREQTELDAAVALVPRMFADAVDASLRQYHDPRVAEQAADLRDELEREANADLIDRLGPETLERIRSETQGRLDEAVGLITEINQALRIDPSNLVDVQTYTPDVLIGDADEQVEPLFD